MGKGIRSVVTRTRSEGRGLTIKTHEGIFWGDGNILYVDNSGGYTTVYIFQNSLNCTLTKGEFYSM